MPSSISAPPEAAGPAAPRRDAALLVVDDAATVRLYYREILGGLGCPVRMPGTGWKGWRRRCARRPG